MSRRFVSACCSFETMMTDLGSFSRIPAAGSVDRMGASGPIVLIAAGGTGGHVYPALALADELSRRGVGCAFLGTTGRLEETVVPASGYDLYTIDPVPFRRRPSADWLTLPGRVRRASAAAGEILKRANVAAVVGFGGYTQVAATLAARRADIPVVIHESNAVLGLANRLAARWASDIAVAHPSLARKLLAAGRKSVVVTGTPLRETITMAAEDDDVAARQLRSLRLSTDAPTLLVVGGSLGAARLNDVLVSSYRHWTIRSLQIVHVTGKRDIERMDAEWESARAAGVGPTVRTIDYAENIAELYLAADAVVCRAGGSTVAELCALGVPAVLVPSPNLANDEQSHNARALERIGAALVVKERQLAPETLVAAAELILADPDRADRMALRALTFGRPDAARHLARLVHDRFAHNDTPRDADVVTQEA